MRTFTLGATFTFCFSSEPVATSLLCNFVLPSLDVPLVVATPLDVDGIVGCPSSTKLMSSGETCVLPPREQVGLLKIQGVFLITPPPYLSTKKKPTANHGLSL